MILLKGDKIYIDGEESKFNIQEFVAPEIYTRWGASQSLRYVNEWRIRAAQLIREKAKTSVTICNWSYGGTYKDSGSRTLESYIRMHSSGFEKKGYEGDEIIDKCLQKYLNSWSKHKYFDADDYKIGVHNNYWSSEKMAELVLDHEKELMDIGVRRMENPEKTASRHGKLGRDWLHLDGGSSQTDYILQVNP